MSETISLDGVSAASLKLLGEDVLIRASPAEEIRASGLIVPTKAAETMIDKDAVYGEVIAVGPGRVVTEAPSAEKIVAFVLERTGESPFSPETTDSIVSDLRAYLASASVEHRVPMPWKPGQHVAFRKGFGPEVGLREGPMHVVGRGNADYGHGVLCAWDPAHVHCWHRLTPTFGEESSAACRCGARHPIETRLPACSECPSGDRLAEAIFGGEVYSAKIGRGDQPGAYEMKPEDDGIQSELADGLAALSELGRLRAEREGS